MVFVRLLLRQFEFFAFKRTAGLYWFFLITCAGTALVAGIWGWWHFQWDGDASKFEVRPVQDQGWRAAMEAVQLGVKAILASDIYVATPLKEMPISLQIARIFGALAFALMVGRIFLFAVGGQASKVFLRARTHHDVVIGDHRLAREYSQFPQKRKTTHLTSERYDAECIVRSGSLKRDLKIAGTKRANRIIITGISDVKTWEEAQEIASIYPNKEILAHISDPWLLERVGKAEPATKLKPFSFVSGVAREVMLAHPPYLLARSKDFNVQHIVVDGFKALGQALVREFLITSVSSNPSKMAVTVLDVDAKKQAAKFVARHPGLESYVDFSFVAADLSQQSPSIEAHIKERFEKIPPCAYYVTSTSAEHPLLHAIAIKDRCEREGWFDAPIFVNSEDGAGLSTVRQGVGVFGSEMDQEAPPSNQLYERRLIPFGSWQEGMDGTALLSLDYDELPRKFHETYLRTMNLDGKANSIEHNWDYLEEEFRVSNRRVAAHIRATLDAAGFDLQDWLEKGTRSGKSFSSTDLPKEITAFDLDDSEEIERLANLQHSRWMLDRMLNGWSYAKVRDNQARKHDCLVPYDDLEENIKEYDRAMVRQIASIVLGTK